MIGKKMTVVIEEMDPEGYYLARSQYDAPEIDNQVLVHSPAKLRPGTFVRVKITKALPYDLIGEIYESSQ
jgi:ribosomal protein S12 methylthiotransferase